MKYNGLWLILILSLITFAESFVFLSFHPLVLVLLIVVQGGISIWGWRIIRQFELNDLYFLDAELMKKNKIAREFLNQSLITFSGIFLLFPGILTDVIGGFLILSSVREWLIDNVFYSYTM